MIESFTRLIGSPVGFAGSFIRRVTNLLEPLCKINVVVEEKYVHEDILKGLAPQVPFGVAKRFLPDTWYL